MKKALIAIIIMLLSFFIWKQYRHFYRVDNIVFTVWKTSTGYCYITPYMYFGVFIPQDNFIKVSNAANTHIYVKDASTLVVFNQEYNNGAQNDIECHFTKFKCLYLPPPQHLEFRNELELSESKIEEYFKNEQLWKEKWEICEKTMSGISLDIRNMNVSTKFRSNMH